jgi:hypothetical protein
MRIAIEIDVMASILPGFMPLSTKSMRWHRFTRATIFPGKNRCDRIVYAGVAYPSVGVAAISASVYAWRGEVKTISVAPSSTMRPCRMT